MYGNSPSSRVWLSRRLERGVDTTQMEGISMRVTTLYGAIWVSHTAPYYNNWTGKTITAARRHKIHGHA